MPERPDFHIKEFESEYIISYASYKADFQSLACQFQFSCKVFHTKDLTFLLPWRELTAAKND